MEHLGSGFAPGGIVQTPNCSEAEFLNLSCCVDDIWANTDLWLRMRLSPLTYLMTRMLTFNFSGWPWPCVRYTLSTVFGCPTHDWGFIFLHFMKTFYATNNQPTDFVIVCVQEGDTLLHFVARTKQVKLAEILILKGALVNTINAVSESTVELIQQSSHMCMICDAGSATTTTMYMLLKSYNTHISE